MTSSDDVMIICSINLAGKPLHMCRRTTIVHLCIHWCPHQINQKMTEILNLILSFPNPVSCLSHIYIHILKHIPHLNLVFFFFLSSWSISCADEFESETEVRARSKKEGRGGNFVELDGGGRNASIG